MRNCKNWLKTYMTYISETETPKHFWFWSGLLILAATLERKVFLPFMRGGIYPNLYVLFIAPPGQCRKGEPIKLARKFFNDLELSLYSDSASKRDLTSTMHQLSMIQTFRAPNGKEIHHSSMVIASAEFSTFLMTNMKEMVEFLTDAWDCPNELRHSTHGKGKDNISNMYLNLIGATTPDWIANNLPEVIQGGGFLSRLIPLSATSKDKWIALPPMPDGRLYKALLNDLRHINKLIGAFAFEPEAQAAYENWYMSLEAKFALERDKRVSGYMERIHIMVLKIAMLLRVAYTDDLTISLEEFNTAVELMYSVVDFLPQALSGHGKNRYTADIETVMIQVKQAGEIEFSELMQLNYMNCSKTVMDEILKTIEAMGKIKIVHGAKTMVKWLNKKGA